MCLSKSLTTLIYCNDESTRKFAIEIIRNLALANAEICQYGGGIKLLCDAIVDPAHELASKPITNTIIYLLNSPETRDYIIDHLQIPKIFSYFTDIDRNEGVQKKEDQSEFETRLRLASNSILIFFRSWPGLIYLGCEKFSLRSLVEALRQPIKPIIRDYIFQLLEEILKIGVNLCPQETHDSSDTMRRSLAQYAYIQTMLLKDAGLYDILLELSSVDNPDISAKAQSQLRLFSHMMYHLLPLDKVEKPDFLMSSINLDETQFDYLRSKCSTIFENMNTKLIRRNENSKIKNEYLSKCEYFYLNMPFSFYDNRINREVVEKLKVQDESLIDESKITAMVNSFINKKEWQKWNFNEIYTILESVNTGSASSGGAKFQDLCENHFFKKLIKYFQPSQHAFIDLKWKPENFIHAKTGYLLIKILLKSQYGRKMLSTASNENFFVVNKGFLLEIQSLLEQDQKYLKQIKTHLTASSSNLRASLPANNPDGQIPTPVVDQVLLNFESFNSTMLREFFSWIGLFTQSKQCLDLLVEFDFFGTLRQFVTKGGSRDHLLRTVLSTLNYNFDQTKSFLIFCMNKGSPSLKISCLSVINLLHKAESPDLLTWVKDPILKLVDSEAENVVDAAISTIEILASDENSLIPPCRQIRCTHTGTQHVMSRIWKLVYY